MGKEAELLEAARTGNLATVEKLLTSKSRKSHVGGAIGQKLTRYEFICYSYMMYLVFLFPSVVFIIYII